jgi:hypothetical protein
VIGEEYYPELWEFEWNNQKATINCLCGEIVEILSDGPETCRCGRMYWLHTTVQVDWNYPSDQNLLDEV